MRLLKLLFLLLLAVPLWAQDMRPVAYQGQQKKITIKGGKILGSSGGVTTIATQDITPTVNATTYVYIDLSSTPAVATSNSSFPTGSYYPICTVVTDINGIITSFTDSRPDSFMAAGGGITSVASIPATCTPGVTAPVQLNVFPYGIARCIATNQWANDGNFYTNFWGLAPQDFGAKGDGKVDNTCTTNSTTTVTCTAARFVAGDAGKVFEVTDGTGVNVTTGTISVVVSSSNVTLSTAVTFTKANTAVMKWATDDTVALRAWAANVSALGTAHTAYLPKGLYYTTKALRFIGPANSTNDCNDWVTSVTSGTMSCSVWIVGESYSESNIWVATAGAFNWAADGSGAGLNTSPVYFSNWAGGTLSNFSVNFDSTAHNTSGQTGLVGGMIFDNVAHFNVSNVWVQGAHNTTNNLPAFMTTGAGLNTAGPCAFESLFSPIIAEINDINLYVCNQNGVTSEKETYSNSFFEHPIQTNVLIGAGAGATTIKQLRFDNDHFIMAANGASGLQNFAFGGASTSVFDCIEVVNSRFQTSVAGAPLLATIRMTGANPVCLELSNTYMETTGAGTYPLILIPNAAHATIRINGGSYSSGNSCASACIIANNDATSFAFLSNPGIFPLNSTDAFMFGGTAPQNITTLHDFTTPFVGFGGRGALQASNYLTATNCLLGGASGTTSPAACGTSAAGKVAIPASQTTYTVNTSAVTANSEIVVQQTNDNSGIATATCNTGVTAPIQASRVAGTSFTISLTSVASVTCIQYKITN